MDLFLQTICFIFSIKFSLQIISLLIICEKIALDDGSNQLDRVQEMHFM